MGQMTVTRQYRQTINLTGSGAPPARTFTLTDQQLNDSCGFVTTIGFTSTITAGFVVVEVVAVCAGDVSGVSVGGVSLTKNVSSFVSSTNTVSAIFSGNIVSGGSQTINLTGPANSMFRCYIAIGNLSGAAAAPTTTGSAEVNTAGPSTITSSSVTINTGGIAIAIAGSTGGGTLTSWVNMTADANEQGSITLISGHSTSAGALSPQANLNTSFVASIASAAWDAG